MDSTTIDKLLGGRFAVEQPAKGYRIAVDTLLLAAAVSAAPTDHILDMGCGVGGVMLAIAARLPGCSLTGIELQDDMASLCAANIRRNAFEGRMNVIKGDVQSIPEELTGYFQYVVMNPPYNDARRHTASPLAGKARANSDEAGELEAWITAASVALRPGGQMIMINRADRQEEIIDLCRTPLGALRIKPIWSRQDGTCKRIILRAEKGGAIGLTHEPPFILYGADGRYSEAGEGVLRHAKGLDDYG